MSEQQQETIEQEKADNAAKERCRVSIEVLMELLAHPAEFVSDEDFRVATAAKRDADALSHAICLLRGDPDQGNAWELIARQYARDFGFYRELVTTIGKEFGIEAYTSDDGSVQDHVLALKVPELVAALMAEVKMRRADQRAELGE